VVLRGVERSDEAEPDQGGAAVVEVAVATDSPDDVGQ
jgi:hypothetical protein